MLTLGTALHRITPLFLVRGCWERSRWSTNSGILGNPSPSSRYRFYGRGGVEAEGSSSEGSYPIPPNQALTYIG